MWDDRVIMGAYKGYMCIDAFRTVCHRLPKAIMHIAEVSDGVT